MYLLENETFWTSFLSFPDNLFKIQNCWKEPDPIWAFWKVKFPENLEALFLRDEIS